MEPGPPAWQARILPLNHQCLVDRLISLMVALWLNLSSGHNKKKKVEKVDQIISEQEVHHLGVTCITVASCFLFCFVLFLTYFMKKGARLIEALHYDFSLQIVF